MPMLMNVARVLNRMSLRLAQLATRGPAVRNQATMPYSAAGTGRRATGWGAPRLGPNDATLGSAETLRNRSRERVRNDGNMKPVVRALVSNLVGTGIRPLSLAPDRAFQHEVQTLWAAWVKQSDPEGLRTFYGQQALLAREWLEAGEIFARLRPRLPTDGLAVPLQVQLIEAEYVPLAYNGVNGANRIRAGVEFTPIGSRAAYWMWRQRPGDLVDIDVSQLVRVPADGTLVVFHAARAGQIRGIAEFTQALVDFYEADQFSDATLQRVKIGNLFAGFKTTAGTGLQSAAGTHLNPITGDDLKRGADDLPMVELQPGMFVELQPGEDVKFNEPPDPSPRYAEYFRMLLRVACNAAGVPYEVATGDMKDVNDRTWRAIVTEFRRQVEQLQRHVLIDLFCQPVFDGWFDRAVLSGALNPPAAYYVDPRPWRAVRWQGQRWAYIAPNLDIQAERDEVRNGFTSLSAQIIERGEDPDDVFAQLAKDKAQLESLGLVLDSDPSKTSVNGAAQPSFTPTEPS